MGPHAASGRTTGHAVSVNHDQASQDSDCFPLRSLGLFLWAGKSNQGSWASWVGLLLPPAAAMTILGTCSHWLLLCLMGHRSPLPPAHMAAAELGFGHTNDATKHLPVAEGRDCDLIISGGPDRGCRTVCRLFTRLSQM